MATAITIELNPKTIAIMWVAGGSLVAAVVGGVSSVFLFADDFVRDVHHRIAQEETLAAVCAKEDAQDDEDREALIRALGGCPEV